MTPCEKLGYNIGDKFTVSETDGFSKGSIVSLYEDDGSEYPYFKLIKGVNISTQGGRKCSFINLNNVTKIEEVNSMNEEIYTRVEHDDGRIEFIPKLVEKEDKDFVPVNGDNYHYPTDMGSVREYIYGGDKVDKALHKNFITYPTKELAEKASLLIKRNNAIVKACLLVDPDFVPNWNDKDGKKYFVYYNHHYDKWYSQRFYPTFVISSSAVSSEEKAEEVIELLNKWGVK